MNLVKKSKAQGVADKPPSHLNAFWPDEEPTKEIQLNLGLEQQNNK